MDVCVAHSLLACRSGITSIRSLLVVTVAPRLAGDDRVNVLALLQNPTEEEVRSFADPRFVFRGFELVDVHGDISAVVNCGGFAKAFVPSHLSDCGLLTDHATAASIRWLLRQEYPDEHHADCDVWAIWQMTGSATNKGG